MHGHSDALDPRLLGWLTMAGHGPRRGRGRHGGPPFGLPGWGAPRGPRARRGDVRAALLVLLAEEPRNGYQLMQEIAHRSDGVWRPSPGSVYPALQLLEDEDLVAVQAAGGGKAYALTDAGRAYVEARREELGAPWDAVKGDMGDNPRQLMHAMRQIAMALYQIGQTGSEAQQEQAKRVLADTRRRLYRILAEDDPGPEADGEA